MLVVDAMVSDRVRANVSSNVAILNRNDQTVKGAHASSAHRRSKFRAWRDVSRCVFYILIANS